ncbi:hypothetical protein AK830_g11829 [Neonectria ditissima]|uniref:Uncharacterized protein n=1 Tax=Neonectria ditissima TaxID=78410 RepID=A0A0P7AQK0_9HYPO|nr:hypothetical protein AK830_g11829 [Neonectria ditissima]
MGVPEDTPDNDKAPPYTGEAPPSYVETTKQHQPQQVPPGIAGSSTAGPSQIPRQFPPAFNLYRRDYSSGLFTLGVHQNQPLYLFAWHSGFSSAPPVLLHAGPDQSFPPLAAAEYRIFGATFDVDLPPVPGSGAASAREEVTSVSSLRFGFGSYRFTIEVGPTNVREVFEWRRSRGDAVASLGGVSTGWKLVRLTRGPPGGVGVGGDVSFVGGGFTDSAGNEVVAAWTMATGSLTKVAKFHFIGTGLTGLLGERWAIFAVVTALALYQRERAGRD